MTRRSLLPVVGALLLFAVSVRAAGTVTLADSSSVGSDVTRYTVDWTADGSGAVSGDTTTLVLNAGDLFEAEFVPGAAGVQPDDEYDVTLLDEHNVDVLGGQGANLPNASSVLARTDAWMDSKQRLQLVVANAGSANQGRVILRTRRHR